MNRLVRTLVGVVVAKAAVAAECARRLPARPVASPRLLVLNAPNQTCDPLGNSCTVCRHI